MWCNAIITRVMKLFPRKYCSDTGVHGNVVQRGQEKMHAFHSLGYARVSSYVPLTVSCVIR